MVALLSASGLFGAGRVVIVADEFPAMETLAARLKAGEGIESRIVKQTEIPSDLTGLQAMIVYIHGDIREGAEKKFIEYANSGGRLILLHHSISSGKRKNQYWTPFTGVILPWGEFEKGGYRWIDPVAMDIANLDPKHYITTHNIRYDSQVAYGNRKAPGFTLTDTEVYLNHVFEGPHHVLLGFSYTDPKTGKNYAQDRAGWYKRAGKGWLLYFLPGHSVREFEHPIYSQIVVNAVTAPLE